MDEIPEPGQAPKKPAGAWMDEVPEPTGYVVTPTPEALEIMPAGGNDPYWSSAEKFGIGALHGLAKIGDTALNVLEVPARFAENRLVGTPVGETMADKLHAYRERGHEQYEQQLGNSGHALAGDIVAEGASAIPFMLSGGGAASQIPRVGAGLERLREGGFFARRAHDALAGASGGAAQAALVSGGNPDSLGSQMGTGALIGGMAGPFLGPIINGLVRSARATGGAVGRLGNRLLDRGAPTPGASPPVSPEAAATVNAAAQELRINPATLDPQVAQNAAAEAAAGASPDAVARRMNMEALGFRPTAAIVNRDPIAWGNERNMAKRAEGTAIADTFRHNNEQARLLLTRPMDEAGGVTNDAHEAGESVINSVRAKFDELQGDISRAYHDVEAAVGPDPVVSLSRLRETLIPHSEATAGIPISDAITRRLTRYGVIDADGNWQGNLSVRQAEELRKFIANEGEGSASANRIARELQMALDDDVLTSTGSDAFGAARNLARQRFAEIESSRINQAIFDEKARPDTLFNNFVVGKSGEPQDLIALRDSLTSGNNLQIQRGTQTWNDLRQQAARFILDTASNAKGEARAMAENEITYPGLKAALAKIGPQRMRILFGDEGAQNYQNILRAVRDSTHEPRGSTTNFSNTAIVGEDRIRQALASLDPGLINGLMSLGHLRVTPLAAHFANRAATGAADRQAANAMREQVANSLLGPSRTATQSPTPLQSPVGGVPNALFVPPVNALGAEQRLRE